MSVPPLVTYLRSLDAVRDRSKQVFDLAIAGQADHWDWHEDKLDNVVDYCLNIIKVSSLTFCQACKLMTARFRT